MLITKEDAILEESAYKMMRTLFKLDIVAYKEYFSMVTNNKFESFVIRFNTRTKGYVYK